MTPLFFEDFAVGRRFETAGVTRRPAVWRYRDRP